MKEIVIISGKGGTGKTSLAASFSVLAENNVIVDCDVDAADMHLVLSPRDTKSEPFFGGKQAAVIAEKCTNCGRCLELCEFDAINTMGPGNSELSYTHQVDPIECEGCGVCAWFCPEKAIAFEPVNCGQWMISQTDHGTLVHARLGIAAENSGKLVSLVRAQARDIATRLGKTLVISDGAPGVGCPVIASITGTDLALVVTEPTVSGLHDLNRVLELLKHFEVQACVCINKFDINPEMAQTICDSCTEKAVPVVGKICYSEDVIPAMVAGKTVVEYSQGPIVTEIKDTWLEISKMLNDSPALTTSSSQ